MMDSSNNSFHALFSLNGIEWPIVNYTSKNVSTPKVMSKSKILLFKITWRSDVSY